MNDLVPAAVEGVLEDAPRRATVILFKPSGKYYTEEDWAVPAQVPDRSTQRGLFMRAPILPADMVHSADFRRIEGGAVLVPDQEPWGYPHLFPSMTLGTTVAKLCDAAENLINEDDRDRQLILEDLIQRLRIAVRGQ